MSLVVGRPRSSSFNSGIENVPNITAFRDLGILRRPRSRVPNLAICFGTLPSELNKENFRYNGRLGSVHRIFVTLMLNVSWFGHLARPTAGMGESGVAERQFFGGFAGCWFAFGRPWVVEKEEKDTMTLEKIRLKGSGKGKGQGGCWCWS
ncbi:hypothetical protein C8J56DRAFT_961617 [Mycena floridula]|nr:hypothetical protein C8J56DRAFT_961617 [Mycena floridula]